MAEESSPQIDLEPPRSGRRRRRYLTLIRVAAILTSLAIVYVSLTNRPLLLPQAVTAEIEKAIGSASGALGIEIGDIILEVSRKGEARVLARNVALLGPDGASLGQFNELNAEFDRSALLLGQVRPSAFRASGAQLTVRRSADGSFGVRLGSGAEAMGDMPSLLGQVERAFSADALSKLDRILGEDLTITLEDARTGRLWQVTGGNVNLRNTEEEIEINLISEVFNGTEALARVQLSLDARKGGGGTVLTARIEDAPARDIALQAPALAFLGALDAKVSGALRTVIAGDGSVESLDGTLDIGAGALQPVEGARPVRFNSARTYFSYDPGQDKIAFSEITVESPTLRMSGTGQAYLGGFTGPWPNTLAAQVSLSELEIAPEGVFAEAVGFTQGAADFRITLDPFGIEFGQVVFTDEGVRVDGSGWVKARADGWEGAADLAAPSFTPERLLSLWPVHLGPQTRNWLSTNLLGGNLSGVEGAVRLTPGQRPRFGFTFDYDAAQVRFLPEMPAVEDGRGHATLFGANFTITVEDGVLRAPDGQPVSIAGSSFQIVDVFAKPSGAHLRLEANAPLSAVLGVMENPPFEILSKIGREADVIDARAVVRAEATFPLKKRLELGEIAFDVSGRLIEARTDRIVPNRVLTGRDLAVRVVPGLLTLGGRVELDGQPLDVTWRQPLGAPDEPGRIEGEVPITPALLDTLGIALPDGSVAGTGTGALTLDLAPDAPPEFTLTSDLSGLTLRIPELGFRKSPDVEGAFEIAGRLGETPEIDRMSLTAPGLSAVGTLRLGAGGVFEAAEFSNVTAGNWLDAPVTLEGQGPGVPPRVVLSGGSVDLARRPDTPSGGGTVPLRLDLDSLRVTGGIVLTDVSGDLTAGTGLNGRIEARVNGGPRITGALAPRNGATAIQVEGRNAGAILRNAGVFKSLDGGTLNLILSPREDALGFDGLLQISDTVLGDQSAVVGMLDAVSVVGLIDQIQGPGVAFDTVEGRFRLTDDRLTLVQGSAVGASLGVSLDGIYDIAGGQLDMQGVMSPIYLLNSVGQIFTRRGEGLFGFTFRLRGDADDPKVSVNPLSILTPGMFREIFRRAPPE